MPVTTGLSGNEIYCLSEKKYSPGNIVLGNSVCSLGLMRSIGTGLKAMMGGELRQITQIIEEGRNRAYQRMLKEAIQLNATGITGVTSQLIFHGSNVEFLSIGSAIHVQSGGMPYKFSTSDNGQALYAQIDAGFRPICFAFGNVAYSIGIRRGIIGSLKTLARGEIKEYSDIFNHTRHLALTRIINHARQHKANAVLGIQTTILPFVGANEMLMIGTASEGSQIPSGDSIDIITSDLTNVEMWNMANKGYAPLRLLLGTSVYSLGLVGGITSALKSFVKGEINELTRMLYDARENALGIINDEAKAIGADDVVGVKTYVYQLGNGLIEFLAIGTAVKKFSGMKTQSPQLPPQALVVDKETFYSAVNRENLNTNVNVNQGTKSRNSGSILWVILGIIIVVVFLHNSHILFN